MSDTIQIILALVFLIGAFIISRIGVSWKMGRVARAIIHDLESRQALDVLTAVELPYAKPSLIRLGMRDYHSKALEYLVSDGTVGKTGSGKYFLQIKPRSGHDSRPANG